LKNLFIILPIIVLFAFSSCTKDDNPTKCDNCTQKGTIVYLPIGCVGNSTTLGIMDEDGKFYFIKIDNTGHFINYKEGATICFDYNKLEDCEMHLQTGIMEIPISCIELTCLGGCKVEQDCYEISYIPTQCANIEFTDILGLKDPQGKYYMIQEDNSNAFKNYKVGDKVKVTFEKMNDCFICEACTCPAPDFCITLNEISLCDGKTRLDCFGTKELDFNTFNNLNLGEHHTIQTMRVEGNYLKFFVGFSGCDDKVKPTLNLTFPPLGAPFSILQGKLIFNRKPQACQAYFRKEVCYDIRDYLVRNPKSISIETSNGTVSIDL